MREELLARASELMSNVPGPVRVGIGWGLAFATAVSLWVTVVWLVAGNAPFQAVSSSWLSAAISYYMGGILGGGLVGLLWSLRRSALGATVLGSIALYPVFVVIFSTRSELTWPQKLVSAAVLSVLLGGLNGFLWWRDERKG